MTPIFTLVANRPGLALSHISELIISYMPDSCLRFFGRAVLEVQRSRQRNNGVFTHTDINTLNLSQLRAAGWPLSFWVVDGRRQHAIQGSIHNERQPVASPVFESVCGNGEVVLPLSSRLQWFWTTFLKRPGYPDPSSLKFMLKTHSYRLAFTQDFCFSCFLLLLACFVVCHFYDCKLLHLLK